MIHRRENPALNGREFVLFITRSSKQRLTSSLAISTAINDKQYGYRHMIVVAYIHSFRKHLIDVDISRLILIEERMRGSAFSPRMCMHEGEVTEEVLLSDI